MGYIDAHLSRRAPVIDPQRAVQRRRQIVLALISFLPPEHLSQGLLEQLWEERVPVEPAL